ncbi:MAG TPA: GAF domain-containing protein [Candidatus Limnocylindria bacterium]|nr:GAF domain-containing protein [Candidatus Limnocylindria bacterium]
MRHIPRSHAFYVAVSVAYAVAVFVVVELTYDLELNRAGLLYESNGPFELLRRTVSLHLVSLGLWIAFSVAAGLVARRFGADLTEARRETERRREELGLVSQLSASLSGPLGAAQVATAFLAAIRTLLAPEVTTALLQYEESAESIRVLAEDGQRSGAAGTTHPVAALPAAMRTKLIGEKRSLVVAECRVDPQWHDPAQPIPLIRHAGSLAALPLVSRARLIGVLLLGDDRPEGLDRDQLQHLALLGQYGAGALHNALSIAEAESRADRESVVNRIAQRIHANLDPDDVLRATTEEVGRELRVSRVLVCVGTNAKDLEVLHEWDAPGIDPVGSGMRGGLPLVHLAARDGRTIAIRDARTDPRLADPELGTHALIERGTVSGIATPIGLGGKRLGVFAIHQVGEPRAWSQHELRLVESVARELRLALETARLFQARKRENERMLTLHHASTVLAAQDDPSAVLPEVLKAAVGLLGQGSASLYRWDENAGVLRSVQNFNAERAVTPVLRSGQGVAGEAFLRQAPFIVNDYQRWPGAQPNPLAAGQQAAIAVPLTRTGRPIGALLIRANEPGAQFTDDDARLLALFGDQAVAALTTAEVFAQQQRAVEQLERLNSAKSDFVSIVSHEFRTPLTGIQGFSELMRDEDLSLDEMKEYAGDINKDAQRLNRMITEMLDLDRMESGRMILQRESIDLNATITEIAERIRPNAPRHSVHFNLDPELPLVEVDRDKVTQVLLNLLGNAVKYSPEGGALMLTTRVEGDYVHVFVRDAGLGIAPDSLEKVFERYSRLESGATRYIQGTGLGLPIVRQIVEMHGGRAWVESTPGEGSVFQFTLPLPAAARV